MRVLVTGSRNWTNRQRIKETLLRYPADTTIIQGGCRGADSIAREIAEELGLHCETYKADWERFGKAAGPIRNAAMLDTKPDVVLAFCLNDSRGTMDCIRQANARGIQISLVLPSINPLRGDIR